MLEDLTLALDRLADAGRVARFWLRDDDAVDPTPALETLLALGLPVTIAAIPAHTGAALADRLAGCDHATVVVHGWSHANYAPPGEKAQELGPHRPLAQVSGELERGRAHLAALHGARFAPVLVPPWNRIAPDVVAALPSLGFAALSVFGPARPAPLPMINTQIDLIDWRGSRGGRDARLLEAEVIAAMQSGDPVGILSHHLVHDAAAWAFLEALVAATDHPGAVWVDVTDLIDPYQGFQGISSP
jgi:peptidoglycan/xylan/chitin deacetylase (PgdA/CDA1 family)